MNLNHLEYFLKIVENLSFSEVAKEFYISQPALSKAISNLEEELGVKLFEKNGRGIKATYEGRVFYSHIKNALEEINRGKKELEYLKKKEEKIIKLAITPNIGIGFISETIGEFLNKNLDVRIELLQLEYEKIVEKVEKDELDICFFESEKNSIRCDKVETALIKEEEYILIVSKKHRLNKRKKVSIKELKDESFILSCDSLLNKEEFYLEKFGYIPKISVKPDNFSGYEDLVAAGAGIALVPKSIYLNKEKVKIIELEEKIKNRYLFIAWKRKNNKEIVKKLKEYILADKIDK